MLYTIYDLPLYDNKPCSEDWVYLTYTHDAETAINWQQRYEYVRGVPCMLLRPPENKWLVT
jgi:hypothetical protein